jgi:hypothetical protein
MATPRAAERKGWYAYAKDPDGNWMELYKR